MPKVRKKVKAVVKKKAATKAVRPVGKEEVFDYFGLKKGVKVFDPFMQKGKVVETRGGFIIALFGKSKVAYSPVEAKLYLYKKV